MDNKTFAGLLGTVMLLSACETVVPSLPPAPSPPPPPVVGETPEPSAEGARQVYAPGVEHLKQSEGFVAMPYEDVAGYCTIGYGHLIHRDSCAVHVPVEFQDGVTEHEGEHLLREDMGIAERAVIEEVSVPLDDHEFASLVSFTYNVGRANFASSTLLQKLNAGFYTSVAMEMRRWVYAGGNPVQGLANRREREIDLFYTNRALPAALLQRSNLPSPIDILSGHEIADMVIAPSDELFQPGAVVTLRDFKVRPRIEIETLPERTLTIEKGELATEAEPVDRRFVPMHHIVDTLAGAVPAEPESVDK